jgi:hypothetical protein
MLYNYYLINTNNTLNKIINQVYNINKKTYDLINNNFCEIKKIEKILYKYLLNNLSEKGISNNDEDPFTFELINDKA